MTDSYPTFLPPSYQVGGSLREDTATYVVRQADHDLYEGLKAGLFCYVLNSRQMGKSSLRVRTMARLNAEGYRCVAFEMRELCVYQVNPDEFYGGFVSHLASEFELPIDLETWWNKQALLHPFLRLGKFIEEVLLRTIESNIVIFIDEIDSILNLEFKDDFFAFIRSCYHKRSDRQQFQRLNFACLGVATPTDLIADSAFTPLNLDSRAIELMGFQLPETQPLIEGLRPIAAHPEVVMAAILDWTGGQPFLTQWVCQIIQQRHQSIPAGTEAHWVAQWVCSHIIDHWRTSDRQQHFQTIRDRILNNKILACWTLGVYQQLLNQGETAVENSRDLMQFRLSGLVVKRQGKLRIYNRIYASIFDQAWTEQSLQAIRPYGVQLLAWEQSGEARYLLQGEELQWSLSWAEGLSLSHGDYQFLSASQAQELQVAQDKTGLALDQEKVAIARLTQVEHQTQKRLWLGALGLALAVASTVGTVLYFGRSAQQLRRNTEILSLEREGTRILQGRSDANQLMDLLAALKAAQRLHNLTEQYDLPHWPVYTPLFALQAVLGTIHERNRWDLGHSPSCLTLSPDGQQIAIGGEDGSISIWTLDGTRVKTIAAYRSQSPQAQTDMVWPLALSWSADGRWLASSSTALTIEIWAVATGKQVRSFDLDREPVLDLRFTPTGTLVAVNGLGKVGLWSPQGKLLGSRLLVEPSTPPAVSRSAHGQALTHQNLPTTAEDFTLSEEGDAVIFTNPQGQPEVRSVQTGQVIKKYPRIQYRQGDRIRHAFRSRDERYTSMTLNMLHFWQADGSSLAQVQVHPSMVNAFSYNPSGDRLITIHPDGTLKLWELNDKKTLVNLPEPRIIPRVGRLYLGNRLNSESSPTAPPSPTAVPNSTAVTPPASPNPASPHSVPSTLNPTTQIALPKAATPTKISGAMTTAQQSQHPKALSPSRLVDFDWDPKTKRIAALNLEGELQFYDPSGQPIQALQTQTSGEIQQFRSGGSYGSLRFSPTGSYLVLQSLNPRSLLQIRTPEGRLLREIPTDFYNLGLEISPDGRTLAIAGAQPDAMELWSPSGQLIKRLDGADTLRFNAQFPTLITATSPNAAKPRITLWSTMGEQLHELASEPLEVITALGASPNGQFMAADNNGKLIAWSAQGKPLYSLDHGAGIMAITYTIDGQQFATTGLDQTIKIWRSDGQLLHTIENVPGLITRLQFSPNGQILAAKTMDSYVYIWQANGELITRLETGGALNTLLSFSADGKRLVSTGGPRLYTWDLDIDRLISQGCDWLQDYLRHHPQERASLPICSQS
jgi:WD40 repeat protein